MRLRHGLRELAQDLLALLWPVRCVACGAPDRDLCADCLAELRGAEGRAHWVSLAPGGGACVAGPHAGPLRALLVACKHAGATRFVPVLGAQLRGPLRAALSLARFPSGQGPPEPALIVTVPSRPARVRERGFRHVELIVRAALRGPSLCVPAPRLVPAALRALPGRTGQVGLKRLERERNAARIAVSRRGARLLKGRLVLLVDDVVTTGATVGAALRVLEAAGARPLAVVALCATERRDAGDANPRPPVAHPTPERPGVERRAVPMREWQRGPHER